MLDLTNKRELCDVRNSNSTMSLSGSFTYTQDKRIIDFSGSISDLQGEFQGSFFYSEMLSETVTKNLNDVPKTLLSSISNFIDETVTDIKKVIDQV